MNVYNQYSGLATGQVEGVRCHDYLGFLYHEHSFRCVSEHTLYLTGGWPNMFFATLLTGGEGGGGYLTFPALSTCNARAMTIQN